MENFFGGLGFQEILIGGLVIATVGFILKKLFKLAISIVFIIALVYYGLPVLQTVMTK
ncbi:MULTISPECIES: hypothetical protein [Desulfosporosinus]|uniref:Uncharacterized protein n=2 Tax=Desulfosporosinus TaxID=79206 RepID=A0A1M6BUX1_9FIRM|nr:MULTISPECIES: hypothetical protein [Desulfosporosinus]MDA8221995.1 hypothetical protein [Desulfitobacterium hafniense]MCB8817461.1 hypothetical protein [Desulfosporosinus sp. SRJS8]MCO1603517.1 hypothetical protein [Desulfosporosinus nitroreducens]MDO0825911.1 hypothetical protein [Desulfosporosinus nitroreducens]SHI52457.1 hypothetical protein SAMN02746098_04241 [Desulfosporosinus lacus DSM 15449]